VDQKQRLANAEAFLIDTEIGEASICGVAQRPLTKGVNPSALPATLLLPATQEIPQQGRSTAANNLKAREEPIKMRLLLILAGLAIGFVVPVLAQEKDTVYPETRKEIEAVDTKLDDAINKNDAAAVAALFTEDAILMLPLEYAPERSGIFSGRQAIEKWFAQKFLAYHVTDTKGKLDQINPVDAGMWAVGEWAQTIDFRHTRTYRAIFFLPSGDSWQIRKMFLEW